MSLSPGWVMAQTFPSAHLHSPAMAEDDEGVLGRLPRSRPGTRSAKRPAGAASGASEKADRQAAPAPAPAPSRSDPLGGGVRAATKAAGAGVRVAGTMAAELLRRLPRP
jgi:hypothetical protein